MAQKVHIKPESKLATILRKMAADKIVITEHLRNGGKISDLHGKIGVNSL